MATEPPSSKQEKRHRSIFDVPANFFDGCRLLSTSSGATESLLLTGNSDTHCTDSPEIDCVDDEIISQNGAVFPRLTCNTCKAEFESLQDQRSHFKSDIHRFNVKLCIAGKDIMKEEDFDELTFDSSKDFDVSSISGSDNEDEKVSHPRKDADKSVESVKQKLLICLQTGEKVSLWKYLIMNESESVLYENDKVTSTDSYAGCLKEDDVISRLKFLVHEPRDNTSLRVVLLAGGGHFAGCIFDGNSVVAHKTFHRYVVRGKAGKKQSAQDGGGKIAHSAGSSLRRYNELALKKEIQELLTSWKPYFDTSSCIFIHAPSSNRRLFFDGDKPLFCHKHSTVRNIPFSVRRPTLKEARRIYSQMTQVYHEIDEKEISQSTIENTLINVDPANPAKVDSVCKLEIRETPEPSTHTNIEKIPLSSDSENEVTGVFTPLHEASQSGSIERVLELLEQGLDPCVKDQRGRTPYMMANEKEVRNVFRRFMASNLDKWDWHAAKVPSALTKEMEESQAAKQAEKDTKKKARAKELKKLRKAKEKKAQAQAVESSTNPTVDKKQTGASSISQGLSGLRLSKEEELKKAQATEREKRAAAAERRMASAGAQNSTTTATPQPKGALTTDILCSCCNASLLGKVPFHRYNYKYCSTTCMHVHKEALEDG